MRAIPKLAVVAGLGILLLVGCGKSSPSPTTGGRKTTPPIKKKPRPAEVVTEASKAVAANCEKGFYTALILHKGEDTSKLKAALEPLAKEQGKCGCVVARVDDAGLAALFYDLKFDTATAPTPLAISLAPNRVVTSVYSKPPTKEAFQQGILPSQPLAVLRALLDGKNVIVKMQSPKTLGNEETNKAIAAYLKDPKKKNFVAVSVDLDKPENAAFLKQMKIDPAKETKSVILGMAPPLKIVNKPFRGAAKKLDIEKAVNPACGTGCGPGG